MAQLAQRDELTGLANRRRFTKALEASWRQCALRDKPLSVLFIDIDAFKQYNDALGHTAGDDCLRRVADILLANAAGPEHTIVRYGGEEFVALLPEADALAARRIAEQMRCAVEQANIEHPAASTGFVTISIGVATGYASREDASTSTLVKDADAALYWAKNKGRNRVVGPRNAGATPHSLGQH